MKSLFERDGEDIEARTKKAVALNYIARSIEMLVFFVNTVIMAHLLTPRDFGILAMVSPILWVLAQFGDFGLASATLQERDLDPDRASVLVFVNMAAGLVLGSAFFACSGLLGAFYGEPDAGHAAAVLSSMFLISGFSAVQIAILRRAFRYRALICAQAAAASTSFLVALAVALTGGGYWALVARAVVDPLVLAILVWVLAPWRLRRPRWLPETKRLLRYGAYQAASSSLNAGGRQIDHVLIGWRQGSFDLGHYALAYRLFYLPVQLIAWPLGHVMIPTLSRLRDQPVQMVAWYVSALRWIGLIAFPLFLILAVCASDVVAVVAGPKWEPAGELLRILAPVGALQVCIAAAEWLLQAHGRSDRAFRLASVTTMSCAAAFLVGLPWGAPGVACGLATASLLLAVPSFAYAIRGTAVSGRDVIGALLPSALYGGATALAVHATRTAALADWAPLGRLAVCAAIGAAALAAACAWMFGRKPDALVECAAG